ncbi:uncharacterized protein LOC125648301 isoform X1 [Ostrea edulis]|uniref:uncharacterized protein LOC125648301 isoform X1 n=1 Tax=Ostrea edulis TaxID=37623 RepID=UPI002095CC3F|nr:uncharacterized protein LOC125648301 isoform X1 [Ostrea edulis]
MYTCQRVKMEQNSSVEKMKAASAIYSFLILINFVGCGKFQSPESDIELQYLTCNLKIATLNDIPLHFLLLYERIAINADKIKELERHDGNKNKTMRPGTSKSCFVSHLENNNKTTNFKLNDTNILLELVKKRIHRLEAKVRRINKKCKRIKNCRKGKQKGRTTV